jgi:hypothetical protein
MSAPGAHLWRDQLDTPSGCRWQDGEVSRLLGGRARERAHAWRFIECDHLRSPTDIAIVNPATSAPTPNETPFGSQSDRTSHLAVRFAEALQDAVLASPEPGDRRLAETAKSYTAFCTVC